MDVKTIVIPVAGNGTRLRPVTYATPKEMLRLVDKPIIYYLIKEAYDAGIRKFIFISYFGRKDLRIFLKSNRVHDALMKEFPKLKIISLETKKRRGDGQCIYEARNILKREKAFAVTMGDLISMPGTSLIGELKKVYLENKKPVISIEKINKQKSRQYGIIDPKKSKGRLHLLNSIVEKPEPKDAPSNYAMTGKYILTPEIFDYLGKLMKGMKGGNEIKLADALRDYARENDLYAYECRSKHFDTGNKLDLVKTEIIFALEHKEIGSHMRSFLKSAGSNKR